MYVLSFYKVVQTDRRYLEALDVLKSKTVDGRMVVENPNRKLAKLEFCQKNQPSELATMRYNELMRNLEGNK